MGHVSLHVYIYIIHAHVEIIHVHVTVHIVMFMDLKATLVSTNNEKCNGRKCSFLPLICTTIACKF